jgi:hypothetical protein
MWPVFHLRSTCDAKEGEMTIPYNAFPTWDEWKTDSNVSGIAYGTWRSSDPLLQIVDGLVQHYNDPNHADVRIETLFYLYGAVTYWVTKLNKPAGNRDDAEGLPASIKVSGHENRKSAMTALKSITGDLLIAHTHTNTAPEAITALEPLYSRPSHGGTADNPGSDQVAIAKVPEGELAVFLQEKHLQRRYKLRFRDGKAWRWDPDTEENRVYDSTDNRESETNDGLTHFVMNTRGQISPASTSRPSGSSTRR